jgi:hypothetical protein
VKDVERTWYLKLVGRSDDDEEEEEEEEESK